MHITLLYIEIKLLFWTSMSNVWLRISSFIIGIFQLISNPYLYDNHVELIKCLRQLGDLESLRDARQKMSEMYPLAEGMLKDVYHRQAHFKFLLNILITKF